MTIVRELQIYDCILASVSLLGVVKRAVCALAPVMHTGSPRNSHSPPRRSCSLLDVLF